MNFSETSTIRHALEKEGTVTVGEKEGADIVIINTCSVTDVAEKKGRQMIRKTVHRNPGSYVVVVGCYAQLRAEELQKIDGVKLVLGSHDKFKVAHYLLNEEEQVSVMPCSGSDIFRLDQFDLAYSYGDRTRSFLKIQDGCDYFCSYCTIPYARGKSRSATIPQVMQVVEEAASRHIREIILTGVNTGDFGRHSGEDFMTLLQTLDRYDGIARYRISSIEPNLLTDEIIDFVASSRHFMPHFHIPLQSGSDEMLRLMKRRYDCALFARKIEKIRQRIPDAFIGVDIIAGTRGEREELFAESWRFAEGLDVSRLHVFPYSERSGTKALELTPVVPAAERHRRVGQLIELSEEKQTAFYSKYTGTTRPVLFEESCIGGSIGGFTDNYIRVELPYEESLGNQLKEVVLGGINENGHLDGNIKIT